MHNNNQVQSIPSDRTEQLRSLAGDLSEVHSLLSMLCHELGGGGIVQARHLEPVIARTVPKLREAVATMNAMAAGVNGVHGTDWPASHNPLLM